MREILFRGKRKEHDFYGLGGEWVYGIPIQTHIGTFICFEENPHYCGQYGYMEIEELSKIIPETVGRYIGLTDKNGVKIFEWDIVKMDGIVYVIIWDNSKAMFFLQSYKPRISTDFYYIFPEDLEVIGNIHDNPELLEVKLEVKTE